MKPISKLNFGPGSDKIRIAFLDHQGQTVQGHIVAQVGMKRFAVTVDGSFNYHVDLAQTTDSASNLSGHDSTILCYPHGSSAPEHVREVWSKVLVTVEGNRYAWSRVSSTTPGTALIDTVGHS